ncbi:MAG TPA: helix-turn-helix transcriptional regulator [Candidatus Limnocylindrales bacterium]|nr:helix-turn-helix transcriptional regulator [Candidatus Limnocylindrales bacterium]
MDDVMRNRNAAVLANRLREARAARELSQGDLARTVGVSRQTISSIETGQYCPSALLAFRLAEALAVSVTDLFWIVEAHHEMALDPR